MKKGTMTIPVEVAALLANAHKPTPSGEFHTFEGDLFQMAQAATVARQLGFEVGYYFYCFYDIVVWTIMERGRYQMKLHYKGKFDGNNETLPSGELEKHKNAVKFKEIDNVNKLMIIMNILAFIFTIIFAGIFVLRAGNINSISIIGVILACLCLYPHEFLHAICFKKDVYMYIAGGGAFVSGTETMSKIRFIFMSMLPNIVFGFIPFIMFLVFPSLKVLGTLGFMAIPMGVGDYYNVFNALTQMPRGARCFMEKQNTYWYMPVKE